MVSFISLLNELLCELLAIKEKERERKKYLIE